MKHSDREATMSNNSTFTVTVDGESVSVTLVRARALCPAEVQAMEEAGEKVSKAAERGDSQATAAATKELQRRMEALLHALAETARQQPKD
jgi:hypothetical protein